MISFLYPFLCIRSCLCVFRDLVLKHRIIKQNLMRIRFGEYPARQLKYSAKDGSPEKVPFGLGLKDEKSLPRRYGGKLVIQVEEA